VAPPSNKERRVTADHPGLLELADFLDLPVSRGDRKETRESLVNLANGENLEKMETLVHLDIPVQRETLVLLDYLAVTARGVIKEIVVIPDLQDRWCLDPHQVE